MAKQHVSTIINGEPVEYLCEPQQTMLDVLRDELNLTGSKEGCSSGDCGACTVIVDGNIVCSCLMLGAEAEGRKIQTIEGIAEGDSLHPVQQAFVDCDGFQCGFCTSGQIMSAVAVVSDGQARTDDDIREAMSGNICRCGAYGNIVDAIKQCQGDHR